MSGIKNKKSEIGTIIVALSLATFMASSAFAGPVKEPGKARTDVPESVKGRPDPGRAESVRTETNTMRVTDILGVSREGTVKVMKEFKNDPENYEAMKNALRLTLKGTDAENQRIVSAYLKVMEKGLGEFHLTPKEIEKRMTNWSQKARGNFAKVLEHAAEAVSKNSQILRETAFNEGLKIEKRTGKYNDFCRDKK